MAIAPYIEAQNFRYMEIVDVILCGKTMGLGQLGGDLSEDGDLITDQTDGDRWITWAMVSGKKQEMTLRSRNIRDWSDQANLDVGHGAAVHIGKTGGLSFVLKTGDGTKSSNLNFSWPDGSVLVQSVKLSGAEQNSLAQVEYSLFIHATCQAWPMLAVTGTAGVADA